MDIAKIEHVIRVRQARDKVIRDLLGADDPDSVEKAERATTAWLEVENELGRAEFLEYMKRWRRAEA